MTENKRFKWEDVYRWEVPAFLEVMNGLDKKNQELKEENKQLKDDLKKKFIPFARADENGVTTVDTEEFIEICKENEYLKQQLISCKDARKSYKEDWKACVSYCDTYKDEISVLKDNIKGLEEELGELKQAYQTLKHRHSLLHDECLEVEFDRDSLKKEVISLENENKCLKKRIKVLEREVQELSCGEADWLIEEML